MSDDDSESLDTSSAFSFTGEVPPFFTRSYYRTSSTFSTETPTDIPPSLTPSFPTSFDVTPLPTSIPISDDPTLTDAFPSSTDSSDTSTPASDDPPPFTSTDFSSSGPEPTDSSLSSDAPSDSPTTIEPSTSDTAPDLSSPTSFSSSDVPFSTFFSTSSGPPFTTASSSTSSSILTTSSSRVTTSPPSSTPSSRTPATSVPVPTPSPTPTAFSQVSFSRSSSSSVTTGSFPSFSGGGGAQSRASTSNAGTVVAATTGSIALAIVLALLAILCKNRHMKRARQRAALGPFGDLDLDNEILAMNQPLIIGDGPAGGAVYTDPFTDDSQTRTRSRSLITTGPAPSLARSGNSFQAVPVTTLSQDHRDSQAAEYLNRRRSADYNSPPQFPSAGIVRNRSYQSLAPVHSQLMPDPPAPRQPSPSFDAGAVAYLRNNDQTSAHSPGPLSTGNVEDHRLISAFSAGSGLSPHHSSPVPPPNVDEMWRSTPDPIAASSSYRPSINRRQSFTPSVSGHVFEPDDSVVISPVYAPTQSTSRSFTGPEPEWNPYTSQGGNFSSRPSTIPEVSEINTHSQEGSNNSGGTWDSIRSVASSHVVMHAQRVQITPAALSLVSLPTPSTGGSQGESLPSYGTASNLPPLPPPLPPLPPPVPVPSLPEVQPLFLGKKRSAQGTS